MSANPLSSLRGDHAGLRVADLGAATDWYARVLDFRPGEHVSHGDITYAILRSPADPGFGIELVAGPGIEPTTPPVDLADSRRRGGWHHLALHVADLDAALAELERRGAPCVYGPFDVEPLALRFAFIQDPWKNFIELVQRR